MRESAVRWQEMPVFTQTNLQDYVTCPRRFELRHLLRVQWPAPGSLPFRQQEAHRRRGEQFHRLAHQYTLGFPADRLSATLTDETMIGWWGQFLDGALDGLPAHQLAETTLSAPLAGYRFAARYDLIAVEPGRAVIVDWKTALRRPERDTLAGRLQTVLYRFLLVRAGACLNDGRPFTPEQVSMIYWFAEFPDRPERFDYDAEQYTADGRFLSQMASRIAHQVAQGFALTTERDHCRFCHYRSLCDRGPVGRWDDGSPDAADPIPFFEWDEVLY